MLFVVKIKFLVVSFLYLVTVSIDKTNDLIMLLSSKVSEQVRPVNYSLGICQKPILKIKPLGL